MYCSFGRHNPYLSSFVPGATLARDWFLGPLSFFYPRRRFLAPQSCRGFFGALCSASRLELASTFLPLRISPCSLHIHVASLLTANPFRTELACISCANVCSAHWFRISVIFPSPPLDQLRIKTPRRGLSRSSNRPTERMKRYQFLLRPRS